jgi:2-oxoglutarate-Fe(II)-dependent oxygenase superfamily protein
VWSRGGRAGQRLVQAPGSNAKRYGFGLVDWRDGQLDLALAEGRRAAPLCAQLRRAADRSRLRGRIAMVIFDNLGIHTPMVIMSALHYPPQAAKHGEQIDESRIGAGAHSDYGCLAPLAQDDDKGGLQVRNSADRWIDAKPIPGTSWSTSATCWRGGPTTCSRPRCTG